ncbi:MAG: hypothetical protein IPO26_16305 [Saprospiraceae bacterium]|nr:hypothetical protein [Saprospiraceae bacterium]
MSQAETTIWDYIAWKMFKTNKLVELVSKPIKVPIAKQFSPMVFINPIITGPFKLGTTFEMFGDLVDQLHR